MYLKIIQDVQDEEKASVKCVCGETKVCTVNLSGYQSLALSPNFLSMIIDQLTKVEQEKALWYMVFADDVV